MKIFEPTVKPNSKRLEGGWTKPLDLQLEHHLVEWIYDKRSNAAMRVSREIIKTKTRYFYENECDESEKFLFVARNWWINNFMRHNGFSLRRKITTAQQDPERLIDKLTFCS